MEEKKKKYEAPKVIRLDDRHLGRGHCDHNGSSDVEICFFGYSAVAECNNHGYSAIGVCLGLGHTAS